MRFTTDARAELSRRGFLKTTGALLVGFSAGARAQGPAVAGAPPANQLDSWIAVAADGSVTAYSGKCELGQGIAIAQQQLVAEELSVPLDRVTLIYCDTALAPDQGTTSGSQSHPANFNRANLGQAAATAREALLKLASERLGVPGDQLAVSDGMVSARNDPSKRASYGALVGGRKFSVAVNASARRKPPNEWKVLGTPAPRPDLAAMVTGQFEFVHNVKVPGMLHGRVVRPPTVGATVAAVDESSLRGLAGVVKVVVKKNFAGVVAEKPWQAIQAAEKLKVTWTPGPALPPFAGFHESLRTQRPVRDTLLVDTKDTAQKLAAAATVVRATYLHPYQMHGSLGSSCAVADVRGEQATIYSPTQAVWYQRNTSAAILGLRPENVRVIFRRGSGCYGINGADTVTYDAAILSQAVQRPVRVQLSRQDEMAGENYGPAYVLDQRAGLDAQGNIVAWEHESWAPGMGGRPGPARPGNVITGTLVGYEPDAFAPRSPAPDPAAYANNSNGIPSYFAARFGGAPRGCGVIESGRVLTHGVRSRFFTGPLRSPARLQNTFAHESFMDELAARVQADPVAFRLRHLRDPRLIETLNAAARGLNWEPRPSPRPGNRRAGVAAGRGIACCLYEGDNGYTALACEVEVNQDTGRMVVKRMVAASDTGPVSNPDGLRNQVEGGALQGLSRALGEEVTWDHEKVTSIDWRTYRSLPLGFEIPQIDCVLLNRTEGEAMGAGETSITVVAAAVANAVFDATGARVRQIPFTPERVKAALAARPGSVG
jgi:CO/xanthine dehydrogenase Mo-binding subunit